MKKAMDESFVPLLHLHVSPTWMLILLPGGLFLHGGGEDGKINRGLEVSWRARHCGYWIAGWACITHST